jgi:hypothetical protein
MPEDEIVDLDDTNGLCVHDFVVQVQERGQDNQQYRVVAQLSGHRRHGIDKSLVIFTVSAFDTFVGMLDEVREEVALLPHPQGPAPA